MFTRQNFLSPRARWSIVLPVLLLFISPVVAAVELLEDAAPALAMEIAAIPKLHGPFFLTWENHSSLSNRQSERLRGQFAEKLAGFHLAITDDLSASPLRVTICETPATYLFVGTLRVGDTDYVRFVQRSRAMTSIAGSSPARHRLSKDLLWEQRASIIDAAERPGTPSSAAALLLLGKESVSLYRFENSGWTFSASAPIFPPVRPRRDLQGHVRFVQEPPNEFIVELAGVACTGSLAEQFSLDCRPKAKQAPIGNGAFLHSSRPRDGVALMGSACDKGPWEIYSDQGDQTVPDHLLLKRTNPTSSALETALDIPGPVLSISSEPSGLECIVVAFNLVTGNYEVYRITLSCGD